MEISGLSNKSQSFILLINVKMPTIVGILTFMSRINFDLSWVEHEKSFITLGPELQVNTIFLQTKTLKVWTTVIQGLKIEVL